MKNILIIIFLIVITILGYVQFKPKEQNSLSIPSLSSPSIDPVQFFSELKKSKYLILDYTGSSNDSAGGNFVVTKRNDTEIKDQRLDLLNKTCGADSSGDRNPCIFISSFSYTEPEIHVIPNRPRILLEWSPILEKNTHNDTIYEEFIRGTLSEYGIQDSETLVFETIQRTYCEERRNKYTLNTYERKVELVESTKWSDACGD